MTAEEVYRAEFLQQRFNKHYLEYKKPIARVKYVGSPPNEEFNMDDEVGDIRESKRLKSRSKHKWLGQLFDTERKLQPVEGNIYGDNVRNCVVDAWVMGLHLKFEIEFDITLYSKNEWDCLHRTLSNFVRNSPPLHVEPTIVSEKYPVGIPIMPYSIQGQTYLQNTVQYSYNTEFFIMLHTLGIFLMDSIEKAQKSENYLQNQQIKERVEHIKVGAKTICDEMERRNVSFVPRPNKSLILEMLEDSCLADEHEELIASAIRRFLEPMGSSVGSDGSKSKTEFIVWGPHLFETYLKHRISDGLDDPELGYGILRHVSMKELTHDDEYKLLPDIVVYRQKGIHKEIFGIIDAKLYKRVWDTTKRSFAVKMDAYLGAFCPHLDINHRRGITFMVVYGKETATIQPPRVRKCHVSCEINIHKKNWSAVKEEFDVLVAKVLTYIKTGQLRLN